MYIINADDFGISAENNSAILKAGKFGILNSTSVMVNTPFVDYDLVNKLFEIENFRVGVHLNIYEFSTMKQNLKTNSKLYNKNGEFHNSFGYVLKNSFDKSFLEEVEEEYRLQIEEALRYFKPTHIDSHVHMHAIPNLFKIVCKLAKEYDIPYVRTQFEKPYFEKYGLSVVAVGHPIADGLNKYKKTVEDEKIITLIPGSRMSEVKKLLPIFHQTIDNLGEDYKFVIPTVETTDEYIRKNIQNWTVKPILVHSNERYKIYANTYIAVAASGTVSAELAMMHIPTIVVYKMNPLTMLLARLLVRVKWVSLVNILMNKTIFPELLGEKANATEITKSVHKLTNAKERTKIINDLKKADNQWSRSNQNAAKLIANDIITSQ